MKQAGFAYCVVAFCVIFALASGGCMPVANSPEPRLYTLRAIGESDMSQRFNISSAIIIRVGPARIPEYLNRPQIVTQNKDKTLSLAQFDRWAEPLDLALARLISADLTVMLPGVNIEAYSWNLAIPVKYQVIVDIIQLESELDGDLFLTAQWSLVDAQKNKMMLMKRFEFRNPINPHSYSGLVETLSMACVSLSSEIASAVAMLATQPEVKGEASDSKK